MNRPRCEYTYMCVRMRVCVCLYVDVFVRSFVSSCMFLVRDFKTGDDDDDGGGGGCASCASIQCEVVRGEKNIYWLEKNTNERIKNH